MQCGVTVVCVSKPIRIEHSHLSDACDMSFLIGFAPQKGEIYRMLSNI